MGDSTKFPVECERDPHGGILEGRKKRAQALVGALGVVFGSIFLAIMSQLAFYLPWTPVPITMQTLGVFLLVLVQGKRSIYSILAYLAQATCGLPVLAGGHSNALWFMAPSAGYLIGFVVAAYLMAWVIESKVEITRSWAHGKVTLSSVSKECSLLHFLVGLVLCQGMIWLFGWGWLSCLLGPSKAYFAAIAPFWLGSLVKIFLAFSVAKPIHWLKRYLHKL